MNELDEEVNNTSLAVPQANKPVFASPIQKLIAKDVNRKEFLTIVGLGILSIAGIAPLIHFLTGKNPKTTVTNIYKTVDSTSGYSRGVYNR